MKNLLTLLFILTASVSFAEPTKPHEQWWTQNENLFETFDGWLGTCNAKSRMLAREHVKNKEYTQLLDVPCGTCIEYFGYVQDDIKIDYTGLDITKYLVNRAKSMGINAVEGSIENLPFEDSSFELVYIRHLLEHLDDYKLALSEAIRVAQKEVLVVFFIHPSLTNPDNISPAIINNALLYHNRYNRANLSSYVYEHAKVNRIEWENVDEKEIIMHVYLND